MANLIIWNCLNVKHSPVRSVGPHQISSWLSQHGYTVKVIDFCHLLTTTELEDITYKHIDSSTIAIGVSKTFWSEFNITSADKTYINFSEPIWVQNARERIESKHRKIKWLLGGSNSSLDPNLKYNWIKFDGLAEDSILKFMDDNSQRSFERKEFDIQELRSSFKNDLGIQSSEVLPIELSRGCQFTCKFCRYPLLGKKKNTYIRNFSLVEHDLLDNYYRYGTTRYFVLDDTTNESDEKLEAMVDLAQRLPFKLEWIGYNRLDLIGSKPHTIQLLKDSGLKSSYFGIESFHPSASKIIGKGWNGVRAKDFLIELSERWGTDINFFLSFIIGLSGESSEDIDNTNQWCIDNKIPWWSFTPLSISKNPNLIWKSIFDSDYRMYGYKFSDPENEKNWTNDQWTFQSAFDKALFLNRNSTKHKKISGWLLGELACVGYSFDELINKPLQDIDFNHFEEKTKSFVKKYTEFQLSEAVSC